jgi:hypothetical protein
LSPICAGVGVFDKFIFWQAHNSKWIAPPPVPLEFNDNLYHRRVCAGDIGVCGTVDTNIRLYAAATIFVMVGIKGSR